MAKSAELPSPRAGKLLFESENFSSPKVSKGFNQGLGFRAQGLGL